MGGNVAPVCLWDRILLLGNSTLFFLRQPFHFEEKAMLLTKKKENHRKQVAATFFDSPSLFMFVHRLEL